MKDRLPVHQFFHFIRIGIHFFQPEHIIDFVIFIKDLDNLEKSAKRAKQLGFQGKMCIYPPQVEIVNRVFTPSDDEVAFARRVVEAFEKAEKEGSSSIQLDGYFIDYPIVYKAQRTLDLMASIVGNG